MTGLRAVCDRTRSLLLRALGRRPGPSPSARDPLGPAGERAAAKFLRRAGYRILGRNLRVPMGEADLLCLAPDRRTIVLVEVKTRRVNSSADHPASPPPEASVHAAKRRKLTAILNHLAAANNWRSRPLRIDVVAVEWPDRGPPVLRHHTGVFAVTPHSPPRR